MPGRRTFLRTLGKEPKNPHSNRPAEQARIVRLLVERVDVAPDHIAVRMRAQGLQTLVEQLRTTTDAKARAA